MRIERFESLGDNCEFGFVLGSLGISQSSLLRWTLTTIPVLRNVMDTDFSRIYELSNLEPSAPRMLLDRGTGLRFHSEMVREKKFVSGHEEIYRHEVNKVMMLLGRLRDKMRDPQSILVYKDNRNPPEMRVRELAYSLANFGKANLLYVTQTTQAPVGTVVKKGPNLWYGHIDRLADYSTANEFSEGAWSQILENADREIPITNNRSEDDSTTRFS